MATERKKKNKHILVERFSIECNLVPGVELNVVKIITLTNHNRRNNAINKTELEENVCCRRQTRENACEQVTIGFSFTSDFSKKWREVF